MKKLMAGIALATALAGSSVQAATIDWTDWSSGVGTTGTISGGIVVTYTGETNGLVTSADYYNPGVSNYNNGIGQPACCTSVWYQTTSFSGGTVANAPDTAFDAIKLAGSTPPDLIENTIHFSEAVANPVLAIWSLGNNNDPASFTFDQAVSLVATGPTAINVLYGNTAGLLTLSNGDKTVSGIEGNGTIQFSGSVTDITFTSTSEYYYGITVGTAGPANGGTTPLPPAWIMLVSGLTGFGFFARRGRKNSTAAAAA